MKNKTIAIIGSPGCGKTTNAVKLAIEIAKLKQNVIYVSLERMVPALPYLLPNFNEQNTSLGDLLTRPSISQQEIAQACMAVSKHKHISLLGYKFGDFHRKYPDLVYDCIYNLYFQLQAMAPYVIIDCSYLIEEDLASNLALLAADIIVRFGSADLKGMCYFNTLEQLLSDQNSFPKDKQITIVSNCKVSQNWQQVAAMYGQVFGVIPHLNELSKQYDELNLWTDLTSKEAYIYMELITKLTNQITGNIKTKEVLSEIKAERNKEIKEEKKIERKYFLHSFLGIGKSNDMNNLDKNTKKGKSSAVKLKKKNPKKGKTGEW